MSELNIPDEMENATARIRELEAIIARLPCDINGTVVVPGEPGWRIQIRHADGHWLDKPVLTADDIEAAEDMGIGWVVAWGGPDYGADRVCECLASRIESTL